MVNNRTAVTNVCISHRYSRTELLWIIYPLVRMSDCMGTKARIFSRKSLILPLLPQILVWPLSWKKSSENSNLVPTIPKISNNAITNITYENRSIYNRTCIQIQLSPTVKEDSPVCSGIMAVYSLILKVYLPGGTLLSWLLDLPIHPTVHI